jgi:hypothetical protein
MASQQAEMRIIWPLVLLFAANGCTDVEPKSTPIYVPTPEGEVVAHELSVDPTPQKITVVTGNELNELRRLADHGPAFVASYLPEVTNPDLKDYDRAFRAWQLSQRKAHSKEQVIELLGGVLGRKCIADLDMEWVTVTDQYGTDFAVRSKSLEVMGFPFSTVMKRIEDGEYDFLYGVYHTLKHTIATYKTRDFPENP